MIRLLTIVGTRPQFVKASALHRCIQSMFSDRIRETLLHTGQHYDIKMSEVFFRELNLPRPAHHLESKPAPPAQQISFMIDGTARFLEKEQPDMVLVYGDTNSTYAGAVAASRMQIPLIHVESGLRSGNKYMQEEMNRILTDSMATLLFVPTPAGMNNLLHEGYNIKSVPPFNLNQPGIFESGDVMLDNFLHYRQFALPPEYSESLPKTFALVTIHRAEATQNPEKLRNILEGTIAAAKNKNLQLVFPIHPSTRKKLTEAGIHPEKHSKTLKVVSPASYLETLWLLNRCSMVFTDSGGLQKEAAFSDKPCVVLRNETEWKELTDRGLCIIGGVNSTSIQKASAETRQPEPGNAAGIFGGGQASARICETIVSFAGQK